jgi:hypothetical protein
MLGSKSANIGLQRLFAMRKTRIWRAFLIQRRKFSEIKSGWLGREDSNLRMGESKSARTLSNINENSERCAESAPRCFNRLAGTSERRGRVLSVFEPRCPSSKLTVS